MNKIFIDAYLTKNFGDDLFVNILAQRYKDIQFIGLSKYHYKLDELKNLKIIKNNYIIRGINKILRIISSERISIKKFYSKKCKATVLIGGSMFIQNSNNITTSYLSQISNYYILGSNFGPFKTNEYKEYYKKIFEKANDVCFREEYSYNLFNELPNVRYASDIVFSLDTSTIKIKNSKRVIISVIDCKNRTIEDLKEQYEKKIIEISKCFIDKGYEVCFMSYCKDEGDEEAIHSILSKCDEKLKNKIKTYNYNGNINEALNIMGDCQVVVGTRFHANIIGLLLRKTIIPIAYSDKTLNVLKDLDYKGKVFDIRKINEMDINSIQENDLEYKCTIDKQIKDAQRQFEKLDLEFKNCY